MKKEFLLCLMLFAFSGCGVFSNFAKIDGEDTELWLDYNKSYISELIYLSDSSIYFKYKDKIYKEPIATFNHIHIMGFDKTPIKKILLVPSIAGELFFTYSFTIGKNRQFWPYSIISTALAAAGVMAIISDNPKVDFHPPLKKEELKLLKQYSRYAGNLDEERLKELLVINSQDTFLSIPDKDKYKKKLKSK